MPFPTYRFRAVTTADLPLLRKWLWCGHVRQWWGDPVHGLARIAEHIVDPAINPFVVECDDAPIGYIQSWNPHAEADHPCRDQPFGTRGIDQFIGEPELIGQGHGTAFIRLFVENLFKAGAPRVVTDPNPRNSRAIRAYAKAGFKVSACPGLQHLPLDGGWLRRRRFASPVETSSRAAARRAG